MTAWFDGNVVEAESIVVPVASHSVGRGSALFEVIDLIATADGPALFRSADHMSRLISSAARMHMPLPYSEKELVSGLKEVSRASGLKRGAIKMLAYYRNPEFGIIPKDLTVSVAALFYTIEETVGMNFDDCILPVTAGISSVRKLSAEAFDVHAKVAGHYVNAFHATWEATQKGYKQAILLDARGIVTEGALCNLFVVKDGTLITSKTDEILLGITRDSIIRIATEERIPCKQIDYTVEELLSADEVFVTGSVIRVQPIKSIDGTPVGDGTPGPLTQKIQGVIEAVYRGNDRRFAS